MSMILPPHNQRALRLLVSACLLLIFLLPWSHQACAAESYAIFSLNAQFDALTINKARKLYRGKTRLFKANELNSLIGQRRPLNERSSIATCLIKTWLK